MSEKDSDIEYLDTITQNPKNCSENRGTPTSPLPNKSSPLSSPKSSINSDLSDLDDPSI